MANITALPTYTNNKFLFWNAKLTNSLNNSSTATSIFWDTIPVDENGATVTGSMLIAVRNVRRNPNKTEAMWIPAGKVNTDGLGATDIVRGLKPSGLDISTGSSSFIYDFDSGDEVFCAILAQDGEMLRSAIQGGIATGAVGVTFGTDAGGETITMYRTTGADTKVGFLRWYLTSGAVEYSNDGTTWVANSDSTASVLVKARSTDTTGAYLNDKIDVATSGRLVKSITDPGANEQVALTLATTLTDAEMNQLSGISANVTDTNLNTLTAGVASDATALHTHTGLGVESIIAGEDINGTSTPQAIFVSQGTTISDASILQSQLTNNGTNSDIFGVNQACQTFTTATNQNRISVVDLLVNKVGTPVGNLVFDLYAVDGAHKPTGASLATVTTTGTTLPSGLDWQTFTLSSEITVSPATEYAMVCKALSTDTTNRIEWSYGSGDTYSGGQPFTSADAGSTWTALGGGHDFAFRVWGREAQTAGRVYKSDSNEPFRGGFDGFVTSNTTSGNSATVRLTGKQGSFTGLTAGVDYFVDATSGAIATSGGLKVGKALSTTEIQIEKEAGFVDITTITSPNIGYTSPSVFYANLNCGFKPSKIEFIMTYTVGATVTVFDMSYTTALRGIYGKADIISLFDVSTFTLSDLTMNTFTKTRNGFRFKLDDVTAAGAPNTVSIVARLYR